MATLMGYCIRLLIEPRQGAVTLAAPFSLIVSEGSSVSGDVGPGLLQRQRQLSQFNRQRSRQLRRRQAADAGALAVRSSR